MTVDVNGGLVQADTRTTVPQPPRREDVSTPSRVWGVGPTVCGLLWSRGWGWFYKVSVLCVFGLCFGVCGIRRSSGGDTDV